MKKLFVISILMVIAALSTQKATAKSRQYVRTVYVPVGTTIQQWGVYEASEVIAPNIPHPAYLTPPQAAQVLNGKKVILSDRIMWPNPLYAFGQNLSRQQVVAGFNGKTYYRTHIVHDYVSYIKLDGMLIAFALLMIVFGFMNKKPEVTVKKIVSRLVVSGIIGALMILLDPYIIMSPGIYSPATMGKVISHYWLAIPVAIVGFFAAYGLGYGIKRIATKVRASKSAEAETFKVPQQVATIPE